GFGVSAAAETVDTSDTGHTGLIVFDSSGSNRLSLDNNVALTVGSHVLIRGQSGSIGVAAFVGPTGTLINNSTTQADVNGGTLPLSAAILNNATLEALGGGTLALAAAVSGAGTITTDTGAASKVTQNGVKISGNTISGLLVPTNNGNNQLA